MPIDRLVGGLFCSEVLELLSEHLDGDLAPVSRASMEAHLADCDACARFGKRFAEAIEALHRTLPPPSPKDVLPGELRRRLGF